MKNTVIEELSEMDASHRFLPVHALEMKYSHNTRELAVRDRIKNTVKKL